LPELGLSFLVALVNMLFRSELRDHSFGDREMQPSRKTINSARVPKDAVIGIRVESCIKAAAERAAAEDCRSVASLIEKLLVEHLRRAGYLVSNRGEGSASAWRKQDTRIR
jgi:hypothetical protein